MDDNPWTSRDWQPGEQEFYESWTLLEAWIPNGQDEKEGDEERAKKGEEANKEKQKEQSFYHQWEWDSLVTEIKPQKAAQYLQTKKLRQPMLTKIKHN